MGFRQFLDGIPLWLSFIGTAALLFASWEAGLRLGRARARSGEVRESLEGEVVGAALALLAFILGFTFSMAESRFDARRGAMLDEAIVLREAYLRAGLVAEPQRTDVRNLLKRYVDARVEVGVTGDLKLAVVRAEALHDSLWANAVAMAATDRSDVTVMAVEGIDNVVSAHVTRLQLVRGARVPDAVWLALYILSAFAMLLVGHHQGSKNDRQWFGVLLITLAFSMMITLIDDIDRPLQGYLKVSQQPFTDLRAWMDVAKAP
jgi:hypothetical protein